MSDTKHEGNAIRDLLAKNHKRVADLASASGVSSQAVSKSLREATIGPGAWDTIARGLVHMHLDPAQIRPVSATVKVTQGRDLRACLAGLSVEQLRNLATILDASLEEQFALRIVIADRIDLNRSA